MNSMLIVLICCTSRDVGQLVTLLFTIAASLGEENYVDYYIRDFPFLLAEGCSFHSCASPRTPPSLFRWIENCLHKGYHVSNMKNLPPLLCRENIYVVSWARKIVAFYSVLVGAERKGRILSTGVYCEIANGSARTIEELTVLAMVGERFGRQQLDLLPLGVSLPLRHVIAYHCCYVCFVIVLILWPLHLLKVLQFGVPLLHLCLCLFLIFSCSSFCL